MSKGQVIKVLDHGFVKLIDHMGSDESIVEAARESTDKGFLGWGSKHSADCPAAGLTKEMVFDCCSSVPGDEKLLAYLYEQRHDTPFEMGDMIIQVQVPIFVLREWHRHRTQSYNEMSARYTPLPDLNYIRYSRMRAKANLRNWLAFLTLRSDNNAQWEIRQYAYAVGVFVSELFPRTWDLFLNHDRKKPVIDQEGFLRIMEAV